MKNEMKSLGKKFSVLRYKYLTSLSNSLQMQYGLARGLGSREGGLYSL